MTELEFKTRSSYDELIPEEQKANWYFVSFLGSAFLDPVAVRVDKS